ncbi:MAG: hypothetical protein ABJE10_03635 [bacterium]
MRLWQSARILAVLGLVFGGIVVTLLLSRPREFVANALLATISSNRLAGAPAIAAALGGLQGSGVQATPSLIVELSRTNDVLVNVGRTPVKAYGGRRLVDLLERKPAGESVSDELIGEKMRTYLASSADMQTGLIRVAITHRDSAVARGALLRLIEEVNRAYLAASHAQARAIAAAQSNRVDSAAARLGAAEDRLLAFVRANRATASYSESALGRTRLERERDFAQTLYAQAVGDRDAAVARALEDTPALIVVDPVPAKLKPQSRGIAVKAALMLLTVGAFFVLWTLASMKLDDLAASTSASDRRFASIFGHRETRSAE